MPGARWFPEARLNFAENLLRRELEQLLAGAQDALDRQQVATVLRRPKGVLVGLASQFGWMPLVAFLLAKGLDLPQSMALGLMVIGCTPGGTTSNLYAYASKADVALSIAMTSVSTVVE